MRDIKYFTPPRSSHWYRSDGSPRYDVQLGTARKELLYSSVSTICGLMPNFGLDIYKQNQILDACVRMPRAEGEEVKEWAAKIVRESNKHRDDAAAWGTGLHKAIENFEAGMPVDAIYEGYMPYYLEFRESEIERVIAPELILVDHDVPAAGRCDLIYENMFHEPCLLDYKSTQIDDGKKVMWRESWLMQLAAYRKAYAKQLGRELPRARSVVVNSLRPEPFQVKEWTEDELDYAYEAFRNLAWVWHWTRDYWPKGRPEIYA